MHIKLALLACSGKVPELLSSAPWISSSGFLILSAFWKGLISAYVSGACHSVRSSAWKPNGVSVLRSTRGSHCQFFETLFCLRSHAWLKVFGACHRLRSSA